MLVVNDAMVLIHLAKISLLEKSCRHFKEVLIPELVFAEAVSTGKEKGYADSFLIERLVKEKWIKVKGVSKKQLVKNANNFNIFGGEAEAVALYWQENAGLLVSDDDNVRSKKAVLGLNLIGTPSIILALFKVKAIDSGKTAEALNKLRKIGWFGSQVLDKILLEVEKNGESKGNRDKA
ncbi:MAG: hypothetical protein V1494_06035 [Candidatus Diapherotrites archaeon]